jgi:hypothetical protein
MMNYAVADVRASVPAFRDLATHLLAVVDDLEQGAALAAAVPMGPPN